MFVLGVLFLLICITLPAIAMITDMWVLLIPAPISLIVGAIVIFFHVYTNRKTYHV